MKKVVIIGGGVAGLTAGKLLMDSGKFTVTLLEGDSRVGGRVHTQPFGGHFTELGAEWIHGEDGNEIYQLANSHRLVDDDSRKCNYFTNRVFTTNSGKVLDEDSRQSVAHLFKKIYLCAEPDPGDQASYGDWAVTKFQEELDVLSCKLGESMSKAVLDAIHRHKLSYDAANSWFEISLRSYYLYKECDGHPLMAWKSPGSASSILSVILHGTPTFAPQFQPELPPWIEMGKEVVKIGVNEGDHPVHVECSDGSRYDCDHLICTVSLGVLKSSYKTMFDFPLPEKKAEAIEHIGFGCVDKIHIDFGRRWWPAPGPRKFSLLWEETGVEDWWSDGVDLSKEVNGFPLWCRGILGFYSLYGHPTSLGAWVAGNAARTSELVPDDELKSLMMKLLRKFVTSYDIPDAIAITRSKWHTNRFSRGTYSYRTMDTERNDVWPADLAEPITKNISPIICFAGEATHDCFFSSLHGAYETGVREANRLLSHHN